MKSLQCASFYVYGYEFNFAIDITSKNCVDITWTIKKHEYEY